MSWTLAGTTVINPYHDGGLSQGPEPIGAVFNWLDGSLGAHKLTSRQKYDVRWRPRDATEKSNLATGLGLLYLTAGVVVTHLNQTETMMIRERPVFTPFAGTDAWEVSATLEETTA